MQRFFAAAAVVLLMAAPAVSQVTPAAGTTPPDDTPSFKVGATIFGDYTHGNQIADAFNVARAYINVTGNLNHWISFRITPDIARETGTGSSLSGSQNFRLKYAFGQFNLDDWATRGTWLRLGVQQTPLIDYEEGIYRYRFQGTIFPEREGYLTSSDAGFAGHYNFPGGYGDLHTGYYNGEGYSHTEANDEKAFQIRASVRPLPLGGVWKGLRLAGYTDEDHYASNAKRERFLGQVTYESTYLNGGADVLSAKDRTTITARELSGRGWSVWLNPRHPSGWELLLRHDDTKPDSQAATKRRRDIAGVAYWFPVQKGLATALLLDYDALRVTGRAADARYALHMLINF